MDATSLLNSCRRLSPATVPVMLDCILSSTSSSPSALFSSLLNEFPNITKEVTEKAAKLDSEQGNHIRSYVAALCHLLKTLGSNNNSIRLFVWRVLIPLMDLIHAYNWEILDEAASLFLDVVTDTNGWGVVEVIIVPLLLRSIGVSMGMLQSDKLAIYEWGSKLTIQGSGSQLISPEFFHSFHDMLSDVGLNNGSMISQSYSFPLPLSCHILSLILNSVVQRNSASGSVSVEGSAHECHKILFAGNMLWDLSNMALQMLSQGMEHRSSAIRFLLPVIFKAFACNRAFEVSFHGTNHTVTRDRLFAKVWKCCKALFLLGPLERRDAYDILSLYLSFSPLTDRHEDTNGDGREETFDLRGDREFWVEIRKGLLDKESLVRKQSLHILKTALNLKVEGQSYTSVQERVSDQSSDSHSLSKRGRWADIEAKSLGVGRICSAVESSLTGWKSWEAFVFLYQMLEEYGTHLVEAAWNHQITLLLSPSFSLVNKKNSCNGEIHVNPMETFGEICEWLAVLLERGFCHDNPQVRCIIMQSFLSLEWTDYGSSMNLVPEDFILGPLIQGLNDPVHHKDFGVKGVYSSWAIEAAAKLLSRYTSYMDESKHIVFLVNLSSVSKKLSFGRAGLMCLAECIASAAHGFLKHNDHEEELYVDTYFVKTHAKFGLENSLDDAKANLLDYLRFILECSKQHFNHNYRFQVCEKILATADSVMSSLDVPLEMLLHFISSVPREYTDYGGTLSSKVRQWLLKCDQSQLLRSISGFPESFISCHLPVDSLFIYDDDDLAAWGSEAKRWTRVLFLVLEEEGHLDSIIALIQGRGSDICQQNNLEWLRVKLLILVSSLVEELQVIKDRTTDYHLTRIMKTETEITGVADSPNFVKQSKVFEKFSKLLLSLLSELVMYAESSCFIFWSTEVAEDGVLPGSITGKLGGPSQRRLSSSVGTSVLQAVTSLKTLGSVLRWIEQETKDYASLNFSLTFLWNFCWKVITASTCKSETQGEICIAAYEAMSYILNDLAPAFSLSPDFLMKTNSLSPSDADRKPVLDIFLSTFIESINTLVAAGNLTRTRRSILMNWKWSCLESLLTMPKHALQHGVHKEGCTFYISHRIIRWIFGDLVESLENAGEVSVLPVLRSVRLTIDLFASRISSCEGMNIQMMWQLVHSSWILHVSCNKRRVAPIAALLSTVLHYSVFGDEGMHETDNAPGPLKWFVEKILEEGTKSPRTIRLATLHLTGLWLSHPITIKFYMKELKLLTLYGSVAFDEDFEAEVAGNHDAKNEVSLLSKSLDPELTDEFINTELYARVSVAVMFDKLADMADLVRSTGENTNSLAAIASGKMFLLELLNLVVNDKDLGKELYKKYSAIHRRKVRAWQMICVLTRFVDQDNVETVTSSLHISIYQIGPTGRLVGGSPTSPRKPIAGTLATRPHALQP